MTPEIARLALQFLARTPLKGEETPAFLAVVKALEPLTVVPVAPATVVAPAA